VAVSSRNIFIGIVLLLLVGVGIYGGMTIFKTGSNLGVTPSPSPSGIIFGSMQNPSASPKQIKQYQSFPKLASKDLQNKKAVIETTKGKIEFSINPEATLAASSFIFLTNEKFFDGLTFHRVEPGFVIQGGDPVGNGTGGPGYKFADEPFSGGYKKGTVAMANSGPNTNGSQFFICLEDLPTLPKNYTIFGQVSTGLDVVSKITRGDVMTKVTIQ
jgi:cyclophilin family peptidyl-prolyl cis-trans isomerase